MRLRIGHGEFHRDPASLVQILTSSFCLVQIPGYHLLFYPFSCSVRLGIGRGEIPQRSSQSSSDFDNRLIYCTGSYSLGSVCC